MICRPVVWCGVVWLVTTNTNTILIPHSQAESRGVTAAASPARPALLGGQEWAEEEVREEGGRRCRKTRRLTAAVGLLRQDETQLNTQSRLWLHIML